MAAATDFVDKRPPDKVAPTLAARLRRWRNRLIADTRFRRAMTRFAPTRWLANKNAHDLFSITTGFVQSQILFACVELDLFARLSGGPKSAEALAGELELDIDPLTRLLHSAKALKLVTRDETGNWWLDDFGAVVESDAGISAMVCHHAMLYRDLSDPVSLLKNGGQDSETARFWAYAAASRPADMPEATASAYSDLMHASQAMIAEEVLDAYPFDKHSALLDIGGGDGTFLAAAGHRHANLKLMLFDVPAVAGRAGANFAAQGEGKRSATFGGNFFTDPLPEGADCLTLVRVLCDHDDEPAIRLLSNIRRAMRPSDCLLIAEAMAGNTKGEALATAYFGFYFLAMNSGRCRRPEEIGSLLKTAGFSGFKHRRTHSPLLAGLIIARP